MNARSTAAQTALKRGDTVELIRLMLLEHETLRLHPAYTAEILTATNRSYCRLIESNTVVTVVGRVLKDSLTTNT